MRLSLLLVLCAISFFSFGQRIDFRNDSLFINQQYVNGFTGKSTIDSLMLDKGKVKKAKIDHSSIQTYQQTKIIYHKKGVIFNTNNKDSSKISVAIKLYKNTDAYVDQNNMSTKTFKGELYIDSNYMNDKRSVDQLQILKNCKLSYTEATFLKHTGIINCTIQYQQHLITALFDFQTNNLTCLFIN